MPVAQRLSTRAAASACFIACFLSISTWAQQPQNRIQGGGDGDIPSPTLAQSSARISDPNALDEIKAYASAIGSSTWQGMHASGQMVYADSPESLPATLSMLPDHRTRLIVSTSKGDDVTVINGGRGRVHFAGAKDIKLPALAVAGGVAPFDIPGLAALHPREYTVLDLGTVAVEGQSMHGVSIQADLRDSEGGEELNKRFAIDFYFDPATHLLRKSAVLVTLPGTGLHRFLRVLTYADYKTTGPALVPSSISETLDGRATWSLQLTKINTTSLPSPTEF